MMSTNAAAWCDAAGAPLRVAEAPMPAPGPRDIAIRNHAIAINPIDTLQQATGKFVKAFPVVVGSDVAGTVHEVGSEATKKFKKGDRVVGHGWGVITGKAQDSAFSLYTNVPVKNVAIIPSDVAFKDAAVLPLAIDTAICGLFRESYLGLPWPNLNPTATGKVILVYGGSSSIGVMANPARDSGRRSRDCDCQSTQP